MHKLPLKKQTDIVRLYLTGLSYDEIARQAGVAKGTVVNVIGDLKAGRILELQEPAERLELLRELAVDLNRSGLTLGQAVAGLAVLRSLQALGVQPTEVQRWGTVCRSLAPGGAEAQAFVRAALDLDEVRQRTGLGIEALMEKAGSLESEVARLEPLAAHLHECQQQLQALHEGKEKVAGEVAHLEKRVEPLRKQVAQQEAREMDLSRRVQELEARAQSADERLAGARQELRTLEGLGLGLEDLFGFVQCVGAVAQRHSIEPGRLRERLCHELEELEAGLGLETLLESRRLQLDETEKAVAGAEQKREALEQATRQLEQRRAALRAGIAEEEAHLRKELRAFTQTATSAGADLKQELAKGVEEAMAEVQGLRDQALELGQQMGKMEAVIKANEWLQTLRGVLAGDDRVSAADVKRVGLTVMSHLKGWIERNQSQAAQTYLLTMQLDVAVKALQRWET